MIQSAEGRSETKKNLTDYAERVRRRKADKRESESNTREKMWEIWRSTSGTSHYLDRPLSAMEKAQDGLFVTRKKVRTLNGFGEASEMLKRHSTGKDALLCT